MNPKAAFTRSVVIAIGSVVGVGALGVGLLYTDLFSVDEVNVSGNQRIDRDAVLTMAGLVGSKPMISIDESTIASRLEREPWVADATVESRWPRTVDIEIVERRALLLARTSTDKWAEVGEGGVVLTILDAPTAGLPVIVGSGLDVQVGSRLPDDDLLLIDVARQLPESLRPLVIQMQIADGDIRLGLSNDVVVELGDEEQLAEKLTASAAVLREEDNSLIATLDVSTPAMPVSTLRTTTQPPAQTNMQARGNTNL